MGRTSSMHVDDGTAHKVLIRKSGGKRYYRRQWNTWEDNINMDLKYVEAGVWTVVIWLNTGLVCLVDVKMKLQVP
jgi:hypothetical protein